MLRTAAALLAVAAPASALVQWGSTTDLHRLSSTSLRRPQQQQQQQQRPHRHHRPTMSTIAPPTIPPGSGSGVIVRPSDPTKIWRPSRNPLDEFLLPKRDVKVWLPGEYFDPDKQQKRFPVLYVHDGQNAMDDKTSWTYHSWRLGSAISSMYENGQLAEQPVVVMIDNAADGVGPLSLFRRRHLEYGDSPWAHHYIDFVSDVLKPQIDAEFRTIPDPEATTSLGTSLGGQISFLSMWRRGDVFGNCACLSPAFQIPLLTDLAVNGAKLHGMWEHRPRIYIDNGGDTAEAKVSVFEWDDGVNPGYWWLDTSLQPAVDAMRQVLQFHGVPYGYHRAAGERHNERAWARRMQLPLLHLYGQPRESSETSNE